ncbi:MAG: hypothetical protein KDA84_12435 [Planctomycetaceae bacterium]|nr:hypothetical protein [Planctomycetaceae bacterium]
MRTISSMLLIGCMVSGCSKQKEQEVSQRPTEVQTSSSENTNRFLTPPNLLNLPALDDWPKSGTSFGPGPGVDPDDWRRQQDDQGNAHFPFSGPL